MKQTKASPRPASRTTRRICARATGSALDQDPDQVRKIRKRPEPGDQVIERQPRRRRETARVQIEQGAPLQSPALPRDLLRELFALALRQVAVDPDHDRALIAIDAEFERQIRGSGSRSR